MRADDTIQAIDKIFNARSVAVVGASSDPTKFGYMTLDSIIRGGYEGPIYPINPKGGELLGLKVYCSLSEVPGRPELVVIIVPAKFVPDVLREAGDMGASGALILSGGFREAGRNDLEGEILSISSKYGMRIAGPNVQGINYLPNKLCAMFYPVICTRGPMAIISQSGTVTAALSEWAADEGLGISAAVNLGNQASLCERDYIDFFGSDQNTKVITMYLEGVKEGRDFLETIERVSSRKPIVILKGGRTAEGQRSAASHTGSMAGSHEVFSAACRQYGGINAPDLETLYDCAKALATMRLPRGNRVLIVSTSGGAGTLGADEAGLQGLEIPLLPDAFVKELKQLKISPLATLSNPLDLVSIDAEHFRQIVTVADRFQVADTVLLNFGDPVVRATEVSKYLADTITAGLAVSYQGGGEEEKLGRVKMQEAGIPVFQTPEKAMRGIAATVGYARYRESRKGHPWHI
jgi:acyl-CoA synthetase (NDP forming)